MAELFDAFLAHVPRFLLSTPHTRMRFYGQAALETSGFSGRR